MQHGKSHGPAVIYQIGQANPSCSCTQERSLVFSVAARPRTGALRVGSEFLGSGMAGVINSTTLVARVRK